jgi:hypothetical protein
MSAPAERLIRTEAVRVPRLRDNKGSCMALGNSIRDEGLRRPITLWKDGTLISGGRRLFAHMLMEMNRIQAVFVDTVEDAAKRLQADNEDGGLDQSAVPMKWSEVCRLWELMRRLDEPAAVARMETARRRGVQLRRANDEGKRKPGRSQVRTDDYVLDALTGVGPVPLSTTTAHRLWKIYSLSLDGAPDGKREAARQALDEIDNGTSSIWANYQRLISDRIAPPSRPRPVTPVESAASARQVAAWERSLPQMEGLVAGLVELGPPNAALTWDLVGPVHTRLMAVRRELEKIIKQMRESNKS